MNSAIATGWFFFGKWTMSKPLSGIFEKLAAILAKLLDASHWMAVMFATINFHHGADCFKFAIMACRKGHGDFHYVQEPCMGHKWGLSFL